MIITKKTEHLQIRVTKEQKQLIKSSAQLSGIDMSTWILLRVLNVNSQRFIELTNKFILSKNESFIFAEINDFLHQLNTSNFELAVKNKPSHSLSNFQLNYIVAMITHKAKQLNLRRPEWTHTISVLTEPYFGTQLKSLRVHLLINSPIAFKQRNIFIDSSIGDRI